jgi:DNA-binding response OmpR family regulator
MTSQNSNLGTVMILDDDRFLADMYSMKFIQKGFAVETYDSVRAALNALRGGVHPVVILFDVVMPDQNGFDFLRTARAEKLGGGALFIALTNQNNDDDRSQAEKIGVDAYFVKASMIPSEVVTATLAEIAKHSPKQ